MSIIYTKDNHNRARGDILDQKNISMMAHHICKSVNVKFTQEIISDIFSFMVNAVNNNIVSKAFIGKSKDTIERSLMENYVKMRYTEEGRVKTENKTNSVVRDYQTTELLKRDDNESSKSIVSNILTNVNQPDSISEPTDSKISIGDIFGKTQKNDMLKMFNPTALYATTTILLDSRYRDLTDTNKNRISWNLINSGKLVEGVQGVVSVSNSINNIKSIKMYPTRIPYNLQAVNGNYKRITVYIEQLPTQAITSSTRRYHFMFGAEYDTLTNFIDTYPLESSAPSFSFVNPIQNLDRISLNFAYPTEPLEFGNDRIEVILYQTGVITEFRCSTEHKLTTGDLVYFTTFAAGGTTNVDLQTNAAINSIHGNPIFYIDNNTFSIDINSTGLTLPPVGILYGCYLGSRRLHIQLEITYINEGMK
jgi:hypothetical protein